METPVDNRGLRTQLDRIADRAAPMRALLEQLAAINSGSHNAAGVARVAAQLQRACEPLGAHGERLPVAPATLIDENGAPREQPLGPALSLRKHPRAPLQVLLVGHLDTVFPADSPFQSVSARGSRLHGPGVADLKGGLVVMLHALLALEASPWAGRLGWRVLLNPDEEIGSPGSAPLLAAAAGEAHIGLVYEPSMPDGALARLRRGSGNFTLVVRGRAAHAGREHHLGRNAVAALADAVRALDQLNRRRDGITVNPARIIGGGPSNVVPDHAQMSFNLRSGSADDQRWLQGQIDAIVAELDARDGIRAELHGGFTRPPKVETPAYAALRGLLEDCAGRLGESLAWRDTGGCCDGNNLAAAGLANVDTLGVIGGGIHSVDEYMELDSLVSRTRLSALLLIRLAKGELTWPTENTE